MSDTMRTQPRPSADSLRVPPPIVRWKTLEQMGWSSRAVLASFVLQTIVVGIIQLYALGASLLVPRFDLEFYAGCFVWSILYLLGMVIEAIFTDNVMQLWGIFLLQSAFVGFGVYQMVHTPGPVFEVNLAILAINLAVFLVLVRWIAKDFNWQAYRRLGADPKVSSVIRAYRLLLLLLKLDFFFTALFCAQQVFIILGFGDYETYLCIIAIPIFLVVWFFIVYAMRSENRKLTIGFIFLVFLGVVYFLYKVIVFNVGDKYVGSGKFANVGKVMLSQNAGYCAGLYLITMVVAILLYRNFGRGLASNLQKADTYVPYTTETQTEMVTAGESDGRTRHIIGIDD